MAAPDVHINPKHHWRKDMPKREGRAGTENEIKRRDGAFTH
jgi:hypothetical protein